MTQERLIQSFAQYGLPEDSPLIPISRPGNDAGEECCNAVVGLRLLLAPAPPTTTSDLVKYVRLCVEGDKALWMEISYGRLGELVQLGWKAEDKAITWVSFYYLATEGEVVTVPVDCDYEPVPVIAGDKDISTYKQLETSETKRKYAGNYDLSGFLKAKEVPGYCLALVYRLSTSEPAIVDFAVIKTSTVTKPDGGIKRVAVIPQGYEQVKYLLGSEQPSLLCYKPQPEALSAVFQPALIQLLPASITAEQLAKASAPFSFPTGLHLSTSPEPVRTHSYVLTSTEGRLYVSCLTFWEQLSAQIRAGLNLPTATVYVPKAICLSSYYPFLDNYSDLLRHIYQVSLSPSPYPLERLIANILQDLPEPGRGTIEVQYSLPSKVLTFARPSLKAIWPLNHCETLFSLLKVETIIQVWSCLMLERQVLLHSSNADVLTPVALALTGLLYPYHWEHVFVPVLPDQLSTFLETVVPYLIGTCSAAGLTTAPAETVIVYLDTGTLHCKDPITLLPDNLSKKLSKRLKPLMSLYKSQAIDPVVVDSALVQDAFLEAQRDLIHDYNQYFSLPSPGAPVSCLDLPSYIRAHRLKPDDFLYQFLQTSLFTEFLEGRCYSAESNSQSSCFDAIMQLKWNKNERWTRAERPQKTWLCPSLQENQEIYQYETFPMLREDRWPAARSGFLIADREDSIFSSLSEEDWARTLLGAVYSLWFLLSSSYPQSSERIDLVCSLLQAANKAKLPLESHTYDKLFEACGRDQLKSQALRLLKCMKTLGVHPDAYYYGLYIQATGRTQGQTIELPKLEEVLVELQGNCPSCGLERPLEEVLMTLERSRKRTQSRCPCGRVDTPRITVTPLKDPWRNILQTSLMSPLEAYNQLKDLGSEKLQEALAAPRLRWSLSLYFSLGQFPSLMLTGGSSPEKASSLPRLFRRKSKSTVAPSEFIEAETRESNSVLRSVLGTGLSNFERDTVIKRALIQASQYVPTLEDLGTETGEITPPQLPSPHLKLTLL